MATASLSYTVKDTGKGAMPIDLVNDINGFSTRDQLLNFLKGSLMEISQVVLKEEQLKGFDKKPLTLVDGKYGKGIFEVSPLGRIDFLARAQIKEIIRETYQILFDRSRVLSGRYRRSHHIFFNGTKVAEDRLELNSWLENAEISDNDKIRFVNTTPYARKLERFGYTDSGSKPKVKDRKEGRRIVGKMFVPNGTYMAAYRRISAKFGKRVFVEFDMLPGNMLGMATPVFKRGRGAGRPYLYPTIIIRAKESGTTDVRQ